MSKVILINGKKRSGKDHCAKLIKAELEKIGKTVEIMSFADPIKKIMAKTFNMSLDDLDVAKNVAAPIQVNNKLTTDMRTVLQVFGTEAMKEFFGEDVWTQLFLERSKKISVDYVLVPDFRFLCEEWVGDFTIKIVNRNIKSSDTHRSENELNDYVFDYTIDNTGKPDLSTAMNHVVEYMINEVEK